MSLWSHTLSRAVPSRPLIHPSSRLLRISFCNHFHICRTFSSETVLPTSKDKTSPSSPFTKRHIATASPTMPQRNRKRASAHVEAQDNQPAHAADVPTPSEATSNGPRRSSRRIPVPRESPSTKENRTGNSKKRGRGIAMDDEKISSTRTESVSDVAKRLEDNNDEAAASALRHLEEMEAAFKSDIKRRRLQIEQSIPNGLNGGRPAPPLKLRGSASSSKSDVVKLDRILLTPEEEKDYAFQSPKDEESLSGDELIDTIKGANRPPAVNSDYLPLPWKGRLGFVSHFISRYDNSARVLISRLGLPEYLPSHRQAAGL